MSQVWTPLGVIADHLASIAKIVDETLAMDSFVRTKVWINEQILPSVVHGGEISPVVFYQPSVFIWLPHILRDSFRLHCPYCSNTDSVVELGWMTRRVIDLDCSMFILAKEYRCDVCEKSTTEESSSSSAGFSSCDGNVVKQLPIDLQSSFPAAMPSSHEQCGITRKLARFLQSCANMHLSPDMVHAMITDIHMQRYQERKAAFEASVVHAIQSGLDITEEKKSFFSSFDDATAYAGYIPSVADFELLLRDSVKDSAKMWSGTIVRAVASPTAVAPALSIAPDIVQGLNSVCGNVECPGFVNCTACQTIQVNASTPVSMVRAFCTTPKKSSKDLYDLESAATSSNAILSDMTTLSTVSSNADLKRKRRPRRCQNKQVVNGCVIVCNLVDCAGRGGQKFCTRFKQFESMSDENADITVAFVEATEVPEVAPQDESIALSALTNFVRPAVRDELLAMEALSNM